MSKTITYKQGDVTYEVRGSLGAWCVSKERNYLPRGTVRLIGEELMYVYTVEQPEVSDYGLGDFMLAIFTAGLWYRIIQKRDTQYKWCSVHKKDYEDIKEWINKLT